MNAPLTNGQRPARLIAGLAVSLALHAALLLAWRPSARAPEAPARESIAVWLRPAPPPKVEPAAVTPASTSTSAHAAPKRRVSANVIALPAKEPVRPDAFTVEPPPEAPHFDLDAARRTARAVANEPDPAKAGTPLAQFPAKPLETETRAARAIARAKRSDCKDGIPGGLLAPLYLMMDKKDSGCKW